jgi:hypothetical protein
MTLPFRVFYVPELPLHLIRHDQSAKGWRKAYREALMADIDRRGLINPLIVLNHPRPKCPNMWLMVGQNRLWAIRRLGWAAAPAVVTGACPVPAQEVGSWEELRALFKDGEPYLSPYGIAIRNATRPECFEYPA